MRFSARVEIASLEGMADPEGRTIERALDALGFVGVQEVHVGKVMRFVIEAADQSAAQAKVEEMCQRLLANPVIERATIHLEAAERARA